MLSQEKISNNTFRDAISTIDEQGKRKWIFPKKPNGKLSDYRKYVSCGLLILLFSGPFIRINDEPILLLNILERKFIILGQVFWPQDFFLFGFAMITFFVFIVLFTVVFGRIWCGWICPQTIFMEMVFRKIEYWIEGDYKQQQALNKAPWANEKIVKKSGKHILFFGISFVISNIFLAYIIGSDELLKTITDNPSNHIGGLTSIIIFTGVFYFIYAWFREQTCTIVCPYGRLQGVLFDKNTILVAYDYLRGEPRGKLNKTKGDCIDCNQCVNVCPTGIDIRNGAQLECINCTACIDACNFMMKSVNLPDGLIRYTSETNIKEKQKLVLTNRIKAYSIVLVLLLTFFAYLLVSRTDIETTILRTPGVLYQDQGNNKISNLYNFKTVNKSHKDFEIEFRLLSHEGNIKTIGKEKTILKPESIGEGAFFIILDKSTLKSPKAKVTIGIYSGEKLIEEVKTIFTSP